MTTRRRPDSATRSCVWLGLHGTQAIYNYMDQITNSLGYAHHYVVDELDTATLPRDRGLAAKVLSGSSTDGPLSDLLRDYLLALKPDVSPWLSDTLINHFVPAHYLLATILVCPLRMTYILSSLLSLDLLLPHIC
jgi:hypothetical protein